MKPGYRGTSTSGRLGVRDIAHAPPLGARSPEANVAQLPEPVSPRYRSHRVAHSPDFLAGQAGSINAFVRARIAHDEEATMLACQAPPVATGVNERERAFTVVRRHITPSQALYQLSYAPER
jgi:hypothetical protein